jgi:hypothetical protein
MSARIEPRWLAWAPACADCGAPFAAPCDRDCPSDTQLDHDAIAVEFDSVPEPCCPGPSSWCGCWSGAA